MRGGVLTRGVVLMVALAVAVAVVVGVGVTGVVAGAVAVAEAVVGGGCIPAGAGGDTGDESECGWLLTARMDTARGSVGGEECEVGDVGEVGEVGEGAGSGEVGEGWEIFAAGALSMPC